MPAGSLMLPLVPFQLSLRSPHALVTAALKTWVLRASRIGVNSNQISQLLLTSAEKQDPPMGCETVKPALTD
jgi:hypothetical protein